MKKLIENWNKFVNEEIETQLTELSEDMPDFGDDRVENTGPSYDEKRAARQVKTLVNNYTDEAKKSAARAYQNIKSGRRRMIGGVLTIEKALSQEEINKMLDKDLFSSRQEQSTLDSLGEENKKLVRLQLTQIYADELQALLESDAAMRQYQAPKAASVSDMLKSAISKIYNYSPSE